MGNVKLLLVFLSSIQPSPSPPLTHTHWHTHTQTHARTHTHYLDTWVLGCLHTVGCLLLVYTYNMMLLMSCYSFRQFFVWAIALMWQWHFGLAQPVNKAPGFVYASPLQPPYTINYEVQTTPHIHTHTSFQRSQISQPGDDGSDDWSGPPKNKWPPYQVSPFNVCFCAWKSYCPSVSLWLCPTGELGNELGKL